MPNDTLIISAEAFSFLRTPRERDIYDVVFKGFDVRPIVLFRDPVTWMDSWRKQVQTLKDIHGDSVNGPGSIFDFSRGSWLLDDTAIRDFFGPKTCALSYETELDKYGSVIPAVMAELGFPQKACPAWQDIWENRT